jgi:hypothetical protein
MRGPRGLALHAAARRLYVLNRISNTITLVDLDAGQAVREIPAGRFDPTPDVVRRGRRVLYDARLSGNGTGSCASCHVDAEMDLIAWNLGNPGGSMQTVSQNGTTFDLHPMKGPMLTQTLRGLRGMAPYHWRGDRAQLADFDGAFATLMGGDTPPAGEMAAFAAFAESIAFMPNPFRRLDRTLPATLNGGDPIRGLGAFNASCDQCHSLRNGGTNLEWRLTPVGHTMKVPHLRNIYQRLGSPRSEGMIAVEGFGLGHDGSFAMLDDVLANPMMGQLAEDPGLRKDVAAFVMSFDTGTAPAVGFSVTLTAATMDEGRLAVLTALEQQAAVGNIDLIAKGTLLDGGVRGLLYRPASDEYTPDTREVAALARDAILERVRTGIDVVTFMGVPAGSGERMGIDRDLDGELDGYQRGRVP